MRCQVQFGLFPSIYYWIWHVEQFFSYSSYSMECITFMKCVVASESHTGKLLNSWLDVSFLHFLKNNKYLIKQIIQNYHNDTKYFERHLWAAPWQNQQNGIPPVWPEYSLSAGRKHGSLATHWAHSEDSDQTGQMPRLIWVFAGCTVILLVLSWGGSYKFRHSDSSWKSRLIRVYNSVWVSISTFLTHYCKLKPHCSNFRMLQQVFGWHISVLYFFFTCINFNFFIIILNLI